MYLPELHCILSSAVGVGFHARYANSLALSPTGGTAGFPNLNIPAPLKRGTKLIKNPLHYLSISKIYTRASYDT